MYFPKYRPRRLRATPQHRRMIRETQILSDHLIYPLFVCPGRGVRNEISSMPGIAQFSVDLLVKEAQEVYQMGIPAVMLFGITDHKDSHGTEAYSRDGIIQTALRAVKDQVPELILMTDVCLCEYTDHGHCGVVEGGVVLNDPSLDLLARTAVSQVEAGADLVAPSDMMDGRVRAIRSALDESGFVQVPILSYAAKFASAFYGPFRKAVDSSPRFGDRKSYQMDPANAREALREIELDIQEGADLIMVKPALPYLDIIRQAREKFDRPLVAYQVSGEYAMIRAAAQMGWVDESQVIQESLIGIRRAGADLVITYFAKEFARSVRS